MKTRGIEKVLVTGGAGFIGSHLVDALMTEGVKVCVFDNLTSGTLRNIKPWLNNPNFTFIKGDLLNPSDLEKLTNNHYELVFHLAANPEVRVGSTNPNIHFQQNLTATHNLLENLRKTRTTSTLIFTSTSTVYGEPTKIPTPENYSPLTPISIYDFIQKLRNNSKELEILGDGTQTKSYLYITDCIEAMLLGLEKAKNQIEIYNVGSEDQTNVKTIAQIIIEEMKLKNVKLTYTGGVDGGRGWKGDVKNMLLDISKVKSLGWEPKLNSRQAIRNTVRTFIQNIS